MKSQQGTLKGTAQIIGPDGKVKGEIKFSTEATPAKREEIAHERHSRDQRPQRDS